MIIKNSKNEIKVKNIKKVLDSIMIHNEISRIELASVCNLAPSTVSQAVSTLLDKKIIMESVSGESTGGRKPIMLEIASNYGCVAIIEITRTGIDSKLYDLHGTLRETMNLSQTRLKGEKLLLAISKQIYLIQNGEFGFSDRVIGVGLLCQDDIPDYDLNVEFSTSISSDIIRLETAIAARCNVPVKKELINKYKVEHYLRQLSTSLDNYAYIDIGERVTASFVIDNTYVLKKDDPVFDLSMAVLEGDKYVPFTKHNHYKESKVSAGLKRIPPEALANRIKDIIRNALIFFPVDTIYVGGKYQFIDEILRDIKAMKLIGSRILKADFQVERTENDFVRLLIEENSKSILSMMN